MVTRMPDGDWHHRIAGDLAQAQNPKQLQAQLQSKVDRYYSTPRSDGTPRKVAAVLMENGKVVTSTFVGTDNSGGKVNENTQFRLGSFSKFMTGLAVDSLVQEIGRAHV